MKEYFKMIMIQKSFVCLFITYKNITFNMQLLTVHLKKKKKSLLDSFRKSRI